MKIGSMYTRSLCLKRRSNYISNVLAVLSGVKFPQGWKNIITLLALPDIGTYKACITKRFKLIYATVEVERFH